MHSCLFVFVTLNSYNTNIWLTLGMSFFRFSANTFTVVSTPLDSSTYIYGGSQADSFVVNATKGDIWIEGGAGSDLFEVWSLYADTTAVFLGQDGNDTLTVDGRLANTSVLGSTIDKTTIRWSGGKDDDLLDTYFVCYGDSQIELFDDDHGINKIQLDCADFACHVLSRDTFLANIHEPGSNTSTVERIDLNETASVNSIVLRLNDGLNEMYFDDTMAKMDGKCLRIGELRKLKPYHFSRWLSLLGVSVVFGGPDRDGKLFSQAAFQRKLVYLVTKKIHSDLLESSPEEFHIGQKYNSTRGTAAGVADEFETTLTTQGYLSDGNSFPLVLNGNGGDDFFDILRNVKLLDLNGDSGMCRQKGTPQNNLILPHPSNVFFLFDIC